MNKPKYKINQKVYIAIQYGPSIDIHELIVEKIDIDECDSINNYCLSQIAYQFKNTHNLTLCEDKLASTPENAIKIYLTNIKQIKQKYLYKNSIAQNILDNIKYNKIRRIYDI